MNIKNKKSNYVLSIGFIFILSVFISILIFTKQFFNWTEINNLTNQAETKGLDYELIIHNELTGNYSFKILN